MQDSVGADWFLRSETCLVWGDANSERFLMQGMRWGGLQPEITMKFVRRCAFPDG